MNQSITTTPDQYSSTFSTMARNILSHRSTTNTIHTWGDVRVVSQSMKQPDITCTKDVEVQSKFQDTKRPSMQTSSMMTPTKTMTNRKNEPTIKKEDNVKNRCHQPNLHGIKTYQSTKD